MFKTNTKRYDEVIHWRQNLFIVPSSNAGNLFVHELARLFQAFADGSSMECVYMKAITIKEDGSLERRHILHEGRCIQRHLLRPGKGRGKPHPLAKTFQRLRSSGKVNKALRCLSGGVLAMIPDSSNDSTHRTTRDILVEKHPPGKPA